MVYGFPGTAPPADLVRRIRRGRGRGGDPARRQRPDPRGRPRADRAAPGRAAAGGGRRAAARDDRPGGRPACAASPGPPAAGGPDLGPRRRRPRRGPRGGRPGALLAAVGVERGPGAGGRRRPPGVVPRARRAHLRRVGRRGSRAPRRPSRPGSATAGVAARGQALPGARRGDGQHRRRARCGSSCPARSCAAWTCAPFRALIAHDVPMVMLGTAIYPALDPGPPGRALAPDRDRPAARRARLRRRDGHRRPRHAGARAGGRHGRGRGARGRRAGSDLLLHTGYDDGRPAAAALARGIRTRGPAAGRRGGGGGPDPRAAAGACMIG